VLRFSRISAASFDVSPLKDSMEACSMSGCFKPTFKRRLRKFVRTCRHKGRLGFFERGRVRDAEAILQDTGCRVKVVVMAGVSGHG
jgi:AraC-like DNA-binding protein